MSDQPKKLIRPLNAEARIIDAKKGLVDYIASDESLDCYREIILAKGWRFSRFEKNAPFVDSHDYWSIDKLLGKVVSAEVRGKQLLERVQWAIDVPDNELARMGFAMTEGGYLKAVSVGFFPTKAAYRDGEGWVEAVKEAGLSLEDAAMAYRIFLEQEQIELSACIIGANPNALLRAFEGGCVAEEQLAACGFGEDETFDFLRKAADACESDACDDAFRAIIEIEMRRIYLHRNHSPKNSGTTVPAFSAGKRVGAEEAEQRAAKRTEILRRLQQLSATN